MHDIGYKLWHCLYEPIQPNSCNRPSKYPNISTSSSIPSRSALLSTQPVSTGQAENARAFIMTGIRQQSLEDIVISRLAGRWFPHTYHSQHMNIRTDIQHRCLTDVCDNLPLGIGQELPIEREDNTISLWIRLLCNIYLAVNH